LSRTFVSVPFPATVTSFFTILYWTPSTRDQQLLLSSCWTEEQSQVPQATVVLDGLRKKNSQEVPEAATDSFPVAIGRGGYAAIVPVSSSYTLHLHLALTSHRQRERGVSASWFMGLVD
jgi:hypothetical protein